MIFLLVGGVALAIAALFFKVLFLPKRMHAGFDRAVESTFLNIMRICVVGLLLIVAYAVLVLNGYLK